MDAHMHNLLITQSTLLKFLARRSERAGPYALADTMQHRLV
jgi:hypothetical protein